jgi:hypothetical protein
MNGSNWKRKHTGTEKFASLPPMMAVKRFERRLASGGAASLLETTAVAYRKKRSSRRSSSMTASDGLLRRRKARLLSGLRYEEKAYLSNI